MIVFLQAYSKFFLIWLAKFLKKRFIRRDVILFSLVLLLLSIRTLAYLEFDDFSIIRFFLGGLLLSIAFKLDGMKPRKLFYFMAFLIIVEAVAVNTVIDARLLPNYPVDTFSWNPHFADVGEYQRPYSFGQNASVTSCIMAILFSLIRAPKKYDWLLLIAVQLIVASGSGLILTMIVLLTSYSSFLKLFSHLVLLTLLCFLFFQYFDNLTLLSLKKIDITYVNYLLELKSFQLREYTEFTILEKFIGVQDVRATELGFGGDFGIASYIYQFGYLGLVVLIAPVFLVVKKYQYGLLILSCFHYPVMFFPAGQLLILYIFTYDTKETNFQNV